VGYGAAGANAAIAAHDAGRGADHGKIGIPRGNSGVCAGAMVIPETSKRPSSITGSLLRHRGRGDDPCLCRRNGRDAPPADRAGRGIQGQADGTRLFPSFLTGRSTHPGQSYRGRGISFSSEPGAGPEGRGPYGYAGHGPDPGSPDPASQGSEGAKEGKEISLLARRGVILACGGYEYNRQMLADFHFPGQRIIFSPGAPRQHGGRDSISHRGRSGPLAHGDGRMGCLLRPETEPRNSERRSGLASAG